MELALQTLIPNPDELRKLPAADLPQLAAQLRGHLLESLNICGGHLSAALGCIEFTIALHYVFNTPQDYLIWDIGHQAHAHKMLTGRADKLHTIRQWQGLAPFPSRDESEYDAFGGGHSSTAISAAMGIAIANNLAGKHQHVVAIIGDGGLTAGLAFEALNHLSVCKLKVLILINDNQISITPTIGGLARYTSWFAEMGLNYTGPVDGHDFAALINTLQHLKQQSGPQILHIMTQKGRGYLPAEQDPVKYHAVAAGFYKHSANNTTKSSVNKPLSYSSVVGEWLCKRAAVDPRLIVITPAMEEGSSLVKYAKLYPQRYFDVGIAEQHSVTLAAGMAAAGYKPVVAIYSTFLQRAYDQLIHDVALQNLPVIFAIDRAGVVGFDGPTHGGFFDLSYMRCIPNLLILAPANTNECQQMLDFAYAQSSPVAVRFPRGSGLQNCSGDTIEKIQLGKAQLIRSGKNIALLAFGSMLAAAQQVAAQIDASVINMRFIKPLDGELIQWAAANHTLLVTIEENTLSAGAGSAVNEYLAQQQLNCNILNLGLPDQFIEHGAPDVLLKHYSLDPEGIIAAITTHGRSVGWALAQQSAN